MNDHLVTGIPYHFVSGPWPQSEQPGGQKACQDLPGVGRLGRTIPAGWPFGRLDGLVAVGSCCLFISDVPGTRLHARRPQLTKGTT